MSMDTCKMLHVILDIDETLVYFIKTQYLTHSWDTLSEDEKTKYEVVVNKNGIFLIRPNLQKFLTWLFAHCHVSLWTYSDIEYAEGVYEKFILKDHPERKIEFIFADEDAEASTEHHGFGKDLNHLWYHLKGGLPCFSECNTILIDDLPNNTTHNSNIKNSITIAPFAPFGEIKQRTDPYHDCSEDTTLLEVVKVLKIVGKAQDDCYNNEDRYDSVFSTNNIDRMNLQKYYKNIYNAKTKTTKPGITAGFSSHFSNVSQK